MDIPLRELADVALAAANCASTQAVAELITGRACGIASADTAVLELHPFEGTAGLHTECERGGQPRTTAFDVSPSALRGPGQQAELSAPLLDNKGQAMGRLSLRRQPGTAVSASERAILAQLAQIAASTIQRLRLYESEREARLAAEALCRSKDELLSTLAHELRSPLNAILSWAHILAMPDLDPAQRDKALSTIRRNVENQTKVIADLADISHISGGTLALQLQPVEVGALVEFAISGVSADAEAKKIRIAFVRPDSAEPASADPERLRQAVSNVLRNAVKFTPEGGTIDVVLSDSAGLVHISVRDSGPGIEHALLPHVFDHFRPVEGQVGRPGGLRLGLAIARALVELHGGTLRARNRGDFSGAEFTVSLPRAAEALSAAQFSPRYETTRPGNLPVDLSGLKVLLVDDEADSLQAHRHALERLGAQVLTAASVREALATLRSSRPDVLLADLGMPEEDGYALIKHVRMLPEDGGGAIPAAAVTGYASRDDHAHTLTAGFQAHVDKPVDLDVLAETVARLAGRTVET